MEEDLKTCTVAYQQGAIKLVYLLGSSHDIHLYKVYGSDHKCYMLMAFEAQSVEGE